MKVCKIDDDSPSIRKRVQENEKKKHRRALPFELDELSEERTRFVKLQSRFFNFDEFVRRKNVEYQVIRTTFK